MNTSVYTINKGINKPIEFKGLKAQFIWWLGGGLLALLILFAIMYVAGINSFVCMGIVIAAGTGLFVKIYQLSHKYGQHGMMKVLASKRIPTVLKSYSRKVFLRLKIKNDAPPQN